MEPPSKPLLHALETLRLCAPADLRRCRGRVRRLARDLPVFDSLWVDALLQIRRLTPFQARALQSPRPEALRIGPCVLVDQLSHRRMSTTYLARRIDGAERCVLKVFDRAPEHSVEILRRLERLVALGRKATHPGVVVPHQCLSHEGRVVTVSRPIDGPSLSELLVRRGRFPTRVVADLAGQLIDALADLEEAGIVHGDVRLNNVRLTAAGQAVLVDAGVKPAMVGELMIHSSLPPEQYDGAAPELIGTGRSATSASDVYALGCLLWQLLAGRPVFATGDPLGKLAAHQTKPVPDVRDRAPDTPLRLAEAIRAFTTRDPKKRPQSFCDLRARWGSPSRKHQRRLARFRREFVSSAPASPGPPASEGAGWWSTAAAAAILLTGLSVTLLDLDARSTVLALPGKARDWWSASESPSKSAAIEPGGESAGAAEDAKPLPLPDARGVIELKDAGPWEAADLSVAGPLVIRGPKETPAIVPITTRTMSLWAERVIVDNVRFVDRRTSSTGRDDAAAQPPTALLAVTARHVAIRGCEFDGRRLESAKTGGDPSESVTEPIGALAPLAGLVVRPFDATGRRQERAILQDALFLGDGAAIDAPDGLSTIELRNALHEGAGTFLRLGRPIEPSRELQVQMTRVTLRGGRAVIEAPMAADRASGRIVLTATDSVFALRGAATGASSFGALVEIAADKLPVRWGESIEIGGDGSLLGPGVVVAAQRDGQDRRELDARDVAIEGLTTGAFEFAGPATGAPRDATIQSYQAPRRSPTPPGIVPTAWERTSPSALHESRSPR